MGRMRWPGDLNEDEDTRFRFKCTNIDCEPGRNTFILNFSLPPEKIFEWAPCPFCREKADWHVMSPPNISIPGAGNSSYSTARADREHTWMEHQIDNTKVALSGEDQVTGKAENPYSKKVPKMEEWEKTGRVRRATDEHAAQRKRLIDSQNKANADAVADEVEKFSETQKKHVGRRHDG